MKLTKYSLSCFLIEVNNKRILIDPGKYCYNGDFKPEDWKNINILLLTHGHKDHSLPEAVDIIYKKNKPLILGSKWVADEMKSDTPIKILEPQEKIKTGNITIIAIKAVHGIHPKMKKAPGQTIGFLIKGNKSVYHCSDCVYMKKKPYADVVLVPISNDYVTMGPEEASKFIKDIKPKLAIPMHYDGPMHPMDPEKFINEMKDSNIKVKILKNNESIRI